MNYYFITGSSKGFGKALAELLLQNENNFVFGYARSSSITHQRYYHKHIDFTNLEAVQKIKFPELKDTKKIVLINNAGIVGEIKHLGNLSNQKIVDCYTVNLIVPSILCNKFIKTYQKTTSEQLVINIISGASQSAIDGWSVYCASKAGLDMFSKVLQVESNINKTNIKVLSIAPGIIDTEIQQQIRNTDRQNFGGFK